MIVVPPAAAVTTPLVHVVDANAGFATVTLAGRLSMNDQPGVASRSVVLLIVIVRVERPWTGIASGANTLASCGSAPATVMVRPTSAGTDVQVSTRRLSPQLPPMSGGQPVASQPCTPPVLSTPAEPSATAVGVPHAVEASAVSFQKTVVRPASALLSKVTCTPPFRCSTSSLTTWNSPVRSTCTRTPNACVTGMESPALSLPSKATLPAPDAHAGRLTSSGPLNTPSLSASMWTVSWPVKPDTVKLTVPFRLPGVVGAKSPR